MTAFSSLSHKTDWDGFFFFFSLFPFLLQLFNISVSWCKLGYFSLRRFPLVNSVGRCALPGFYLENISLWRFLGMFCAQSFETSALIWTFLSDARVLTRPCNQEGWVFGALASLPHWLNRKGWGVCRWFFSWNWDSRARRTQEASVSSSPLGAGLTFLIQPHSALFTPSNKQSHLLGLFFYSDSLMFFVFFPLRQINRKISSTKSLCWWNYYIFSEDSLQSKP